jgi:hypothetical protein
MPMREVGKHPCRVYRGYSLLESNHIAPEWCERKIRLTKIKILNFQVKIVR